MRRLLFDTKTFISSFFVTTHLLCAYNNGKGVVEMKTPELIAIIVVAVIAAAELICLFICSKHRGKSYPLCTVLPLFSQDSELSERLDYLSSIIEDGSLIADTILLIDYCGSAEQLQLCSEFCDRYHSAELISPDNIEPYLKKPYKK